MDIFPFQVHGNPGSFPVSWEPLLTFHFFNGNLVLNQNPGYPERNYEEIGEKKNEGPVSLWNWWKALLNILIYSFIKHLI